MRFVLGWLSLGFVLKWIRENEQWRKKLFDFVLVILSFALIIILLGVVKVGGLIALLTFAFWLLVLAVVKTN